MEAYWSQYWQQGYLTSFGSSIKTNYQGAIKEYWFRFFDKLTNQDKVLDIGTGNGALIALAQAYPSLHCNFVGIDYANVNICDKSLIEKNHIEFISNIQAEELIFGSGEFTAAIAQFSLEYTNIEQSIEEISRVLVDKGKFQFVCHHSDSLILQPNSILLKTALRILDKDGVLDTLKQLINELEQMSGSRSKMAEKLRNKFNNLVFEFLDVNESAFQNTNFPSLIKSVFTQKSFPIRQEIICQFEEELAGQISRITQLSNAALNQTDKENLLFYCEEAELVIEKNEIMFQKDGQIIAHVISGRKFQSKGEQSRAEK
jgi:ubiquinone/menaquinone biosynthesis C-methylase UbiE